MLCVSVAMVMLCVSVSGEEIGQQRPQACCEELHLKQGHGIEDTKSSLNTHTGLTLTGVCLPCRVCSLPSSCGGVHPCCCLCLCCGAPVWGLLRSPAGLRGGVCGRGDW